MIAFMHVSLYYCKAAITINVGLGLESVVWLGLAFGIIVRLQASTISTGPLARRLFLAVGPVTRNCYWPVRATRYLFGTHTVIYCWPER